MSDPVGKARGIHEWIAIVRGVNIMKLKRRETPTIETLLGRLSLRFVMTNRIREMSPNNEMVSPMAVMLKK